MIKITFKEEKVDLKKLYNENKDFFYNLFLEDFIGEIPKDVREPAMTFLSYGKEKVEKWALFMAHVLQRKIELEPDRIKRNQGMLLMLKLLMVHASQPVPKITQVEETEEEEKNDFVKDVEEVVEELKNKNKEKLSTS